MSFDSDYQKLRKKRMQANKRERVGGNLLYQESDIAPTNAYQEYRASKREEEEDIAPVAEKRTFFKNGEGNVVQNILGTVGDIGMGITKGLVGLAEGVVDLVGYGAAGVVDLLGDDESADEAREYFSKNSFDNLSWVSEASEFADKYSYLGDKSDAVLSGLGQVAGIILTGGAGAASGMSAAGTSALTTGVIGASSWGGGMSEAYQGGASEGEAWAYGALKGAIDAGTELIFGGLGKGVKALGLSKGLTSVDDMFAKTLSSKIANRFLANTVEFGVKASAEGLEEVLAGIGTAAAQKLTYMSEEDIGKLLDDQDLLEQFMVGAITSGIAQGGDFISSVKNDTDFVSRYTDNEQAVINKEVENRIAEREKNGEKLTRKQKDQIYDAVAKDLENGGISIDTIESVLGKGASYEAYKSTTESESKLKEQLKSLQDEYDVLQNKTRGEMTGVEMKREAELEQQIEQIQKQIAETQEKGKGYKQAVSEGVYRLAQKDRLVESYNEVARRYKRFEADVTQYDEKQATIVQKAIDSGILNNTRRSHELVDLIARLSAEKGVDFDFTNNQKLKESGFAVENAIVNGYRTEDGITINVQSKKYLNTVVGHEITHVLEGTDLYAELQKAVFNYARTKGEYDTRYDATMELYKGKKGYEVDENLDAKIKAEVTADLVGDYLFTDSDFVANLHAKHRNVFQKIFDEIKYLLKIVKADSTEARELEKAKRAFEKALQGETKAKTTTPKTDTKFSISDKSFDINDYTIEELLAFTPEQFAEIYDSLGLDDVLTESDVDDISFDDISGELNVEPKKIEILVRRKGLGESHVEENRTAVMKQARIDEAIEDSGAKFHPTYARKYITRISTKDFIDLTVTQEHVDRGQFDAEVVGDYGGKMGEYDYESALSNSSSPYLHIDISTGRVIGHNGRHRIRALEKAGIESIEIELELYDEDGSLIKYNAETIPDMAISSQFDTAIETHITNVIPLNEVHRAEIERSYGEKAHANAGVRYSLSDSDGKQLTAEQQEYFKDSKMRDENGNLQVMYHGSQDAGFHVFDPNMSDDDTSFFFVDRNDVAASYSGTTETYEAQSIRTADDMNKFIESIGAEGYEVVEKDGKFTLLYEGDRVADSNTAKGIYEEFCWYEGVGEGDANYKVYLNLKNPLEIDAKGRPWNKIDAEFSQEVYDKYNSLTAEEKAALVDLAEWEDFRVFNSEIQEAQGNELASAYAKMGEDCNIYDLFSVAADNFSEDAMRENARKYLNTREYAQRAKAEGYDGVIFRNIIDNGGYSNGSEGASTVAIAFESNQIKSVANGKPTADADIRFSLSSPIEETRDLLVLHNISERKLLKQLELDGFPMPSLAVTNLPHTNFGSISILFDKDTIDPKKNKKNKTYSADAWTPTFPRIEYETDRAVERSFIDAIEGLIDNDHYRGEIGTFLYDAEDVLNRNGGYEGLIDYLAEKPAIQYAFLKAKGENVDIAQKQKEIPLGFSTDERWISRYEGLIADFGGDISNLGKIPYTELVEKSPTLKDLLDKYPLRNPTQQLSLISRVIDGAKAYQSYDPNAEAEVEYIPDYSQTEKDMRARIDTNELKSWLKEQTNGIVANSGVYNGKEVYTQSGNRRSFQQLHYPVTVENIVKSMASQGEKSVTSFHGVKTLRATTAKTFKSIAEIQKAKGKLQNLSEAEIETIHDELSAQMYEVFNKIIAENPKMFRADDIFALDTIGEVMSEVEYENINASYIKGVFGRYGYNMSSETADDCFKLLDAISSMPVYIFEAKPQRVVGYDEIKAVVIPASTSIELKNALTERGISFVEYDGTEADRQAKLKEVATANDSYFSLSAEGEAPVNHGDLHISSEDVAFDGPTKDLQDLGQNAMPQEENAPVDMSGIAPLYEEEMPVGANQAEIDRLTDEMASMESRMMEAYQAGDEDTFLPLMKQYEEMFNRRAALQSQENGRTDSLTDADAPPEFEAPYYGEVPADMSEGEAFTISKKGAKSIAKDVSSIVGLNADDRAMMENIVQAYAQGELTEADLAKTIRDNFSYAQPLEIDETLTEAKQFIKGAKLYINKQFKADLNGKKKEGLNGWRLDHFGHFTLSTNEASGYMGVDQFYGELNEKFPELFPDDYDTPPEQLERIGEVMDMVQEKEVYVPYDESTIAEVVNAIKNGVTQGVLAEQQNALYDEIRAKEDIAPVFEHDSGQLSMDREAAERKFYDKYPSERPRTVAEVRTTESNTRQKKEGVGAGQWFMTHFVSQGNVFENIDLERGSRELQARFHAMKLAESKAQAYMKKRAKPIVKELHSLKKAGLYEDFQKYCYHVHNIDRMSLKERYGRENLAVFDDSITADVSREKVKAFEAAHPEFKGLQKELVKYFDEQLQMLVDGGVISQELANKLREMYPNYIPIRRSDKSEVGVSVPLDTNKTGVNSPLKRATGGNSDIDPILGTLGLRTQQTFRAIARNRFGLELRDALKSVVSSEDATIADALEFLNDIDDDTTVDTTDEKLLKKGTSNQSATFTVFDNGKRVTFDIPDAVYDALAPKSEIFRKKVKVLNKGSEIFRKMTTEYNAPWVAVNAFKDFQEIFLNSQHALRTYLELPNAYLQIVSNGKYNQEFVENGGDMMSFFNSDTKTFGGDMNALQIAGKVLGLPFEAVGFVGNIVERAPRLAEYIASRKMGKSIEQSMLDAGRVTTDFSDYGDISKFLNNNGATFFTASISGFNQQIRNFKEAKANGVKGMLCYIGKLALMGLPAMLINHLVWGDDDEIEGLQDYVKDSYYIIGKTEDGNPIRIPKGRTAAVIQNAFEQMQNLVTGDEEVDWQRFGELLINNLAPNNFLTNNILAPISQVWQNKTWYGEELVPSRLQDLPAAEQYDESTDEFSKWLAETPIGKKFGWSPYKINYLLDQYGGGISDMLLPMYTQEAESGADTFMGKLLAPWKDKFTADAVFDSGIVNDFYTKKDELTTNAKSKYATDEDILKNKYINSVNDAMSDLYRQQREIQNSDLADSEKYAAVREVQEQINELAREGLEAYEDIEIDEYYARVGDRHYRLDDGTWTKISDKQLERQQEVTEALGISPSEYWSKTDINFMPVAESEYEFAYENPEEYQIALSLGGYDVYKQYKSELYDIKSDYDENGKPISGSRKEKVIDYLNELDADWGEKLIIFKSEYNGDDTFNQDIVNYLSGRSDIDLERMLIILKELGFEVHEDGRVSW